MGQWRSVPQPPEGTLVVAVKGNSCCGRNIDSLRQMAKPHFVQMTDRQWQQFISDISLLMKSYTNFAAYGINCGMAFLGLLFMLVMIHACFSLSFGVVTIVGGSFLGCVMARFVTMQMRSENRAIDLEIESVLAQGQLICGGSATFTFDRKSTEVCALCANTELAPEYRALRISPGVQQSMSMQMTVPEGMSPDERPRSSSRSAGGSPTSGIVQVDKIGSEGRFHNARVEASSRHHGRTCTMNDLKSLISSKNTTSLLLERDLLLILHNP